MAGHGGAGARQGGWAGLLALLLALAIVALLAGTVLRQYGLAGGTAPRAGQGAAAREAIGGIAPVAVPDGATPSPRDAISRARGLEDAVRQQAADYDKRIDAASK
jgi:hypothetical protein